jgi:tRNA (guanine-N7-)-methyltransferase
MTPAQRHALEALWPTFGLQLSDIVEADFLNDAALTVEIGFGMGDSLVEMAEADPARNFLGIEVHRPGVGHLLIEAEKKQIRNLKVLNEDSIEVLSALQAHSVDRLQVFFPDPWPKKKHHKRRLINRSFLDLAASVLHNGGCLHVATDWAPYAEEILMLLNDHGSFQVTTAPPRVETKYEKRGIRLGHEVFDIAYLANTDT